jgi:hypothetical protein
MKQVEAVRTELPKYKNNPAQTLIYYKWVFTEDEKKKIKEVLRGMKKKVKHSSVEVDQFISHLEFYCQDMKNIRERPKEAEIKLQTEDILKSCKETLRYLTKVERGKMSLLPFNCIPDRSNPENDKPTALLREALEKAWQANTALQSFIKTMENIKSTYNKSRGRKRADNSKFVLHIAKTFREHIGNPTKYKDGPFYDVVRACFDAIGLPCNDPSRAIKDALATLNK